MMTDPVTSTISLSVWRLIDSSRKKKKKREEEGEREPLDSGTTSKGVAGSRTRWADPVRRLVFRAPAQRTFLAGGGNDSCSAGRRPDRHPSWGKHPGSSKRLPWPGRLSSGEPRRAQGGGDSPAVYLVPSPCGRRTNHPHAREVAVEDWGGIHCPQSAELWSCREARVHDPTSLERNMLCGNE